MYPNSRCVSGSSNVLLSEPELWWIRFVGFPFQKRSVCLSLRLFYFILYVSPIRLAFHFVHSMRSGAHVDPEWNSGVPFNLKSGFQSLKSRVEFRFVKTLFYPYLHSYSLSPKIPTWKGAVPKLVSWLMRWP